MVAGNLFAKVSDDIRNLFIREKVGYQYIWILTLTMVISVLYVLLGTINNIIPSSYGVIIVSLLAIYGIIRFMYLGFRTFYFFDPTKLSGIAREDIEIFMEAATVNGFRWKNKNFQYHYQRQANNSLTTLKRLIIFASDKLQLFKTQLFAMSASICKILETYEAKKRRIPTTSFWFSDKTSFQNWMLADSTSVILALNTGTTIQPKVEKDLHWFEKRAIAISLSPLDLFIETNASSSLIQQSIENYIGITTLISGNLDKITAEILLEGLEKSIQPLYEKSENEKEIELISITDSHSRIPIGLVIGLDLSTDKSSFDSKLRQIDWKSNRWPYASDFPSIIIQDSEVIRDSLQFEKGIEDALKSPAWYLETLHTRNYLNAFKNYFEYLVDLSDAYFKKRIEAFKIKKQYICAAQVAQRWQEYLNKFEGRTDDVESFFKHCEKYRLVKDLPWIEVNFVEIKKRVKKWQKEAVIALAEMLPYLDDIDSDNLPDYFGQAYTFASQEVYDASLTNDQETFNKIFPYVFSAALKAQQKINKKTEKWNTNSRILFSMDPLIDILELSGYAKIYSELYEDTGLWDSCKIVWEQYLNDERGKDKIEFIATLMRYKKTQLGIMPKDMIRSNWEINLIKKLNEKNLISDTFSRLHSEDDEKVSHNSKLIREIASRGPYVFVKTVDLFISLYIKKHPNAQDVDLSFARDFIDEE
jgi:hypothetical protein